MGGLIAAHGRSERFESYIILAAFILACLLQFLKFTARAR